MSYNDEIARLLYEFADRLEADGVEYKPNAYRRAAENIADHPEPIDQLAMSGQAEVEKIDRVGDAIASKVVEYFETGEIAELSELRESMPVDMAALTSVEGVGPKTVGTLYEALDITDLDELETAAEAGEIQEIKGFGAKTEQNILDNIPFARQSQQRERLGDARPIADRLLDYLDSVDAIERVEVAGSIRRWKDTIGDVDVLTASEDSQAVVDAFTEWEAADDIIEAGSHKSSLRADDVRVDLRVVVPEEFGAALQYFTGSKDHNVRLRNVAIDQERKLNEYGVFDVSGLDSNPEESTDEDARREGIRLGGETEAEMYEALGLPWIPPELREDTGEIQAATEGELPDLLEQAAIRGDLHTHSEWSDGRYTIREMAEAAANRGYAFHAVTDHAAGAGIIESIGLTDEDLREQADEIAVVRDEVDIDLLHGVETNIEADGSLSTSTDLLADLDVVVASPHSALDQDTETATERICKAIREPTVDIIGHPTGRMINSREGLPLDVTTVAECAAEHGTALEVNANPLRLDFHGEAVRAVVEAGGTIAINTDAHGPGAFDNVRYGVQTARRGWAEADDVINTWDSDRLRSFISE
ncbi:DNA polymerase (family 10) [Halohasta litchfieldiae]|jgi:DNA polymerase (family 10)|uniref:DNA polymerase beta n=1 Tax=Halohasta litchfieldiae TaxID=1073996 RepID=A0A1H6UTU6_9EURY|nr:DNA polymerase/3'-5' exonuclease PolX [Halohasta litchfieldiae]ATW88411.1 DNA polymerase (family 10) [Halohasta litchfieldiae]SEI95116.1 DNA polymerase (family 10) [Halohasta litchfieldiae]